MATTSKAPTSTRLHSFAVGLMTLLRIIGFGGVVGFLLGGRGLLVYYGGRDLRLDTGRALLVVLGFVIGGTIGFFLERAEERARRRGGGLAVLLLTRALEGVPIGFLVGAIISDRVGATNSNVYLIVGSIAGAVLGILIEWAGRNVSDGAGLLVMRILRALYKGGMAGVSGATVGLVFAVVSLLQNPPSVSVSPGPTTGNPAVDVIHAATALTVSDLITLALMYFVLAILAGFGAVVGAIIGLIDGILLEFSWRPAKH